MGQRRSRSAWESVLVAGTGVAYAIPINWLFISTPGGSPWLRATILWAHIWFALVGVFWYLPLVQRDETLYLYNSQKISDGATDSTLDDVHEVHGCETLPCTDQTSVTFRVRASWFNEVWSFYHHGTFFYPGYVAGAVAPIMEKCTITSYGIRKKFRSLLRTWDVYPDLLQVKSCSPVNEEAPILHNKDYR